MATAEQIRRVFNDTQETFYTPSGVNQALAELLWHSAFAMNKENKFSVSTFKEKGRLSVDTRRKTMTFDKKKDSIFTRNVFIQSNNLLNDISIFFQDDAFKIKVVYTFGQDAESVSFDPSFNKIEYTLPYDVAAIPIISDLFIRFLANIN